MSTAAAGHMLHEEHHLSSEQEQRLVALSLIGSFLGAALIINSFIADKIFTDARSVADLSALLGAMLLATPIVVRAITRPHPRRAPHDRARRHRRGRLHRHQRVPGGRRGQLPDAVRRPDPAPHRAGRPAGDRGVDPHDPDARPPARGRPDARSGSRFAHAPASASASGRAKSSRPTAKSSSARRP